VRLFRESHRRSSSEFQTPTDTFNGGDTMKPNQLLGKALRHLLMLLPAVFLALVTTAAIADNRGHDDDSDRDRDKAPLVLKEQGSFFVGGELVFSEANFGAPGPTPFGPGLIAVDHMYVQFQIPKNKKYRYPLIMVHGGGHTGKTYETTPDGREGWFTSFTRRGFAPYVVDDPNRGRACCEGTQIALVRQGLADPSTLPLTSQTSIQPAWSLFRFGPAYPNPHPGVLFPIEAIEEYARQLGVLSYRDPEELDKIRDGIVALLDEICPCILMTHSQSGTPGRRAAVQRPDLVKAIVAVEGGDAFPEGSPEEAIAATIPLLQVEGDFRTEAANNARKAITDRLASLGGDAMTIVLPEIGIHGNTHMMMMDKNNEQVADVIEDWINEHVQGVRDHDHHDNGLHRGHHKNKHTH
jgi:pimeloyl-ACP methyl ester carboxylesterase